MNLETLDVGCGFTKDWHIDWHIKRGEIGIDLRRGKCDIVADAQHLPFRQNIFDKIYLYAILEHLEKPIQCLRECSRVAKDDARFEIEFPTETHPQRVDLKRFFLGFPISPIIIVLRLRRLQKYGNLTGFRHINRIQPHDVARVLKIVKLEMRRRKHLWFANPLGRSVGRFLGISFPLLEVGKSWRIEAIKSWKGRMSHKE